VLTKQRVCQHPRPDHRRLGRRNRFGVTRDRGRHAHPIPFFRARSGVFWPKPSRLGHRQPGSRSAPVTGARKSTMAATMLRWNVILLCMLMMSLTTTAVVHANEVSGPPSIECSGYVHSEGDKDESQGDTDKATPHHHSNCQGGAAFVPAKAGTSLLFISLFLRPFIPAASIHDRWSSGPDLRPPIA